MTTDPFSAHASLEDRGLVASRLGTVALFLAALFAAFWLVIAFLLVAVSPPEISRMAFSDARFALDLGIGAALLLVGLWLRRPGTTPGPRLLHSIDLTLAAACGVAAALHPYAWRSLHLEPVATFVLISTYTLVLRSAIMPVTKRHTIKAGVVAWVAGSVLLVTLFEAQLVDDDRGIDAAYAFLGMWGVVTVAIAAGLSHVVHGLRTRVHAAEELGHYRIESKLAEGGMGVIYRASHVMLRRPQALKLLKPELDDPTSVARFEREVRLTSQLRHPNTVAVHDFGRTPEGVFYFAMELLEGVDIQALVDRGGPLQPGRALYLLEQVVSALSEAHEAGLIHRDIKPSNIFVSAAGPMKDWIKVLDFGLVQRTQTDDPALSQNGAIVGTPAYMAPEQVLDADAIDARADLYSLGCVAYFMLTATPVFEGDNPLELCVAQLRNTPVPAHYRNPDVTEDVQALLDALLQKKAENRPASALEVLDHIRALRETHPWNAADSAAEWERDPELHHPPLHQEVKPSGVTVDLGARDLVGSRDER